MQNIFFFLDIAAVVCSILSFVLFVQITIVNLHLLILNISLHRDKKKVLKKIQQDCKELKNRLKDF